MTLDQKHAGRPDKDTYFLRMAQLVASRSTCLRRSVGCVLVNERGHVLATGYNGVAAGMPHCNELITTELKATYTYLTIGFKTEKCEPHYPHACPGAQSPSGTNLDGCQAIHAEQNALLQCRDTFEIYTCYCTASPCLTCTKLLMNTSCKRIVFIEEYPHEEARILWQRKGPGQVWFNGVV